ncbi:MAG: hypothetical protein K9W43_01570 [Candidatus Thorarchaeota archaeon]|nr:hypothetical protein [Candidatus Thorarchaeota archaeon]
MFEPSCPNTGLPVFECGCLDCNPIIHRFKFIGLEAGCKTIDDIIDLIQSEIDYFIRLKELGFTAQDGDSIDYLELRPIKREGFYWGRCKNCGNILELPIGTQQPDFCQQCRSESQNE